MSERYEPCVTNAEGNCTRWSHDPDAPEATDPTPGEVRPDVCPSCGPGYRYGDEGCRHTPPGEAEPWHWADARLAARDAEVEDAQNLAGALHDEMTIAVNRYVAAEAEAAEKGRQRALWFGENSRAQAELATVRAEVADLRAKVERVEALADDNEAWVWTAPVGPGNASYANGYENGRRSLADDLRAALGGEHA